jgi:hypothetical protein
MGSSRSLKNSYLAQNANVEIRFVVQIKHMSNKTAPSGQSAIEILILEVELNHGK